MATYDELQTLAGSNPHTGKIERAITIKADLIKDETTPSTERIEWAKSAFADPNRQIKSLWNAMLAANNGLTVTVITGLSDAQIQSGVNAAVDGLVK